MTRILRMLRGTRRSRQRHQCAETPVFERLEPRLLLNADMSGLLAGLKPIGPPSAGLQSGAIEVSFSDQGDSPAQTVQAAPLAQPVPYSQDFGAGQPGSAQGWEYYSDNEGRIAVVGGRLRMDDTLGNATYSLNEAILHVNLTGKTGVTLTLDHSNLLDEPNSLPGSFSDHYKGDGIALSVDGTNWVKVTDLSSSFTNKSFSLDSVLVLAKAAAGSSDVSDVRIKFQQYDNYPASTDGREFDNIRVTLAEPEMEVLGNGQEIVDGDTAPSAIDHTDFGNVNVGSTLTRTFTIRNTGGTALNLTGSTKVLIIGSGDFTVAQPSSPVPAGGGTTTFQIKFTPSGLGLVTATVWIANDDSNENPYDFKIQGVGTTVSAQPQSVPYSQDFGAGQPGAAKGWEYYSDNEGRIAVVGGRLRMDDTLGNATYSLNEAILHVNLTGKTGVTLTLDHSNLSDEPNSLPGSFSGHYKGDGIALSVNGTNWVKVTDLNGSFTNQSFSLDSVLVLAKAAAGSSDVSDVRIKFQQYDNYPAISDGREFDNIWVT